MRPMEALGSVGTGKNPVGGDKSGAVLETDSIKTSGNGVDSYSPEVLQSSVWTKVLKSSNGLESNAEKSVVLSNEVDGLELLNVEPMRIELPTPSDNAGLIDPFKVLEHETSELSKDSHTVDIAAPVEDMSESSCLKLWSPPNWPITDGNVSEKTVSRNYPPQRRILVNLDFPPFGGRNAPCLSKEDHLKTPASSKSKSLGQEKSGVEDKLLEETVRTILKQIGDEVQDEDNLKSKFKAVVSKNSRDQVQAESEGDCTKEASKQVQTGTFSEIRADREDTREKSLGPPHKSDLNHPDHKSQTDSKEGEMEVGGLEGKVGKEVVVCNGEVGKGIVVYNGEVGGSEGKVGKEIVVQKNDKSLKRKFSGSSARKNQFQREDAGLEFAMDRVIVQGLMAAPNCPWGQGKGAFKPNPAGGMQGSEGKKHDLSGQEKSKYFLRARKADTENLGSLEGKVGKDIVVYSRVVGGLEVKVGKEIVVRTKDKSPMRKFSGSSASKNQFQREDAGLEFAMDRVIVQGLMAAPNCPWGQGKGAFKPNPAGGMQGSEGKKHDLSGQEKSKYFLRARKADTENLGSLEGKVGKDTVVYSRVVGGLEVKVGKEIVAHTKDKSLKRKFSDSFSSNNQFQREDAGLEFAMDRVIVQGLMAAPNCPWGQGKGAFKPNPAGGMQGSEGKKHDLSGQEKSKYFLRARKADTENLGGLEGKVGKDIVVYSRVVGGLEVKVGKEIVVHTKDKSLKRKFSGSFSSNNQFQREDVGLEFAMDRVIVQGLMASPNCPWGQGKGAFKPNTASGMQGSKGKKHDLLGQDKSKYFLRARKADTKNMGGKSMKKKSPSTGKAACHGMYVRDEVDSFVDDDEHEVKTSKKFKIQEGLCVNDISQGKELIPICAVNTIDNEKPPPFKYITRMMYPNWYCPIPLKGCDCTDECSDSEKCSCAVKNGGEIPYNYNGAIVEAKPLVYECGPSCKCPPSCHNRVSQHGIKFQLEIFKTESRGWGVRSLNSIPSGSFICELLGELLEEEEAEQRTGNDEYLFDIGRNYNDHSLWDGLSNIMSDLQSSSCDVVEDGGFTIDAVRYGNVGRFINHSCSPNLYAQNVLYDNEEKRIPHIMLFATEKIPPLQELTYHYNYTIDQVCDSDGNIKKKNCYCGSPECTGRMY